MRIGIKTINENAVIPKYQTEGSAGFDLHSTEEVTIKNGQVLLIKTGLVFDIPKGYEIQIRPRSGLALKHGISVWNSPGTVDSDYTGEVGIILVNGGIDYTIKIGDRIAQGVVAKVEQAEFIQVEEVAETTRQGGFGSTGTN